MMICFFNFIEFLKIRDDGSKLCMGKHLPSWSVVATVDEPPALVQAFVAWYLALGASQVFIYFDRPDDPVLPMLAQLPQVTVVLCDTAHWQRVGKSRPRRHEVRQVRNAQDADARADTDWILHCDADEFVWAESSLADALARLSPDIDCLVLPVAERVHDPVAPGASIFEGAFRRPFRDSNLNHPHPLGPDYALTYRGLTGHAQGKALVRRGRSLRISIHRPRPASKDLPIALERADVDSLELLHFEGLTPAYWAYKLSRMVHALTEHDGMPPSPHRRRQADALIAGPNGGPASLYRRLKYPDAQTVSLLKSYGLWADRTFDPSPLVAQYFSGQPYDPSPAAIDRWLIAEKPRIVSYLED